MRIGALVAAVLVLTACGQAEQAAPAVSPSPSAVTGCPDRISPRDGGPEVPALPTTETPGRLVPDADPVEALVCRYGERGGLAGEVLLEGGLDRVRTDLLVPARLEGAERACTLIGGGVVPHLLRLRYADGELWLSAVQEPNRCSTTSNGAFISSAHLGGVLAQAYDSATWPSRDPDPCAQASTGRAGQEQGLVPAGWTSLVRCDEGRREVAPDLAAQAASLLGQLQVQPGTGGCAGTPASVRRLAFTYAEGPQVVVTWTPGCDPSLDNGSLSAVPTPAQTELLGVLLG
jgi:hypothetical protein